MQALHAHQHAFVSPIVLQVSPLRSIALLAGFCSRKSMTQNLIQNLLVLFLLQLLPHLHEPSSGIYREIMDSTLINFNKTFLLIKIAFMLVSLVDLLFALPTQTPLLIPCNCGQFSEFATMQLHHNVNDPFISNSYNSTTLVSLNILAFV